MMENSSSTKTSKILMVANPNLQTTFMNFFDSIHKKVLFWGASTYEEGQTLLTKHDIRYIILEEFPPNTNSMQAIQFIQLVSPTTQMIVIAAKEPQLKSRVYEFPQVMDYIQPTLTENRLQIAVEKLFRHHHDPVSQITSNSIFVKAGRQLKRFMHNEILFIEAYAIYSKIHTSKTTEVVNEGITSLETRLPHLQFARVHKSYIVNVNYISSINKKHITLLTEEIPLGKSYREKFESILELF